MWRDGHGNWFFPYSPSTGLLLAVVTFFKCCPKEMQAYILANALVLLTLRKSVRFLHVHFKCDFFFPNLFLLLSQGPCPILCFPVESGNVVPKRPSQRNYIFLQRLVVELMLFCFFHCCRDDFLEIFKQIPALQGTCYTWRKIVLF